MSLAAAPSTLAGIGTFIATVLIAAGGVITALGVAVPLLRASKRNSEALKVQESKLDVIHTLVDGTLSAALNGQLDAIRRERLLTMELFGQGDDPPKPLSDDQKAILGSLRRRIDELAVTVRDRERQTRSADIQIEAEAQRTARG